MNVNVASSIAPSQLGIAGDPSIDRTHHERTPAERQTEDRSAHAELLSAATARPAGSDPVLWDSLTAAEQDYFATLESIGTLSYAPGDSGPGRVAPLGQRLDVRA